MSNKQFMLVIIPLIIYLVALYSYIIFINIEDIKYTKIHQNQERVCTKYSKHTTTTKRFFSIVDTYDSYEYDYCEEYKWVDK